MLNRLFRPRPAQVAGRALYARAVDQARAPAFYERYAAPDTTEGRFELYSLHVLLLIDRLQGEGDAAAEVNQALFDAFVKSLDDALREMGVGDLSVGKKMRKLGEAFFGRAKNYRAAFEALPDREPLEALLARTVYAGADSRAAELADYVLAQREALAGQPAAAILEGHVEWRAP
ncbi:ubiquinol-cytochrome C chaperone family protein [Phenylobacterium sp.]|jgi:cytochrome b pre-mRNA-processing protein 3|uniref:ubiquinol-cytochrome C chaperone family protein n=1 Tax=Phenylobacterium sp. TaxID=1871053 RepID=UPI002F95895C